jgi:hypothetical protein
VSVLTAVEQMAEPVGFDIAHSTDEVQAALLNGLARGLAQLGRRDRDVQLSYITGRLTPAARKLVTDLAAFVEPVDG